MGFQHLKKFLRVCLIEFIAAIKIVKRILGNNNFDSLSPSPLTCCNLTFATIYVLSIQFNEKVIVSPKLGAQILCQSAPMKRKQRTNL